MLPTDRRGVGDEVFRHGVANRCKMSDGIGHVGCVPVHDGGDDEIEAGGAVELGLVAAIDDAALPECADSLGQGVALLALIEAGLAAPAQGRVLQPVEHEESAFDPADLLQREIELVPALEGG